MQWCDALMTALNHPHSITTAEFFRPGALDTVPDWYTDFVYAARAHVNAGAEPQLALAPREFVDHQRDLVEVLCQEIDLDRDNWPELRQQEG